MQKSTGVKSPEYLTEAELEALLRSALDDKRRYGVRDALLISLAYHHCMRASELVELKLSDIVDGKITVNRKKDSEKSLQPLLSESGKPWLDEKRLLKRYLALRAKHHAASSDRLFLGQKRHLTRQQVWNIVHDCALAAGLPASKARSHILKHTGISHLVQRGMPLLQVAHYAGHRDFRSTLWYAGVSQTDVNKAAAVAFAQK